MRRIALAPLVAGVLVAALAAGAAPVAVTGAFARSLFTPLAKSPELWATVDVCNAPHHPNTIGIRGSMPSDGHPRDAMYIRFLVQSLDATTKQWADLGKSADSGFVPIGSAASTRQAGRTFEFKPTPSAYTLRGQVEFQWRRNGRAVHLVSVPTTAGHKSLAGAEPKGFSAAACVLP
ncbi:MAG: hypothetical protein ABSH36_05940 [Solirubrobacteraceae bacterium]